MAVAEGGLIRTSCVLLRTLYAPPFSHTKGGYFFFFFCSSYKRRIPTNIGVRYKIKTE